MKPAAVHPSDSKSEQPPVGSSVQPAGSDDLLSLSVVALGQGSSLLTGIVQLAAAEVQLAGGSLGRMLLLALAMALLLIFAWTGLSVLIGWSVGAALDSVLPGLAAFLLIQCLAMGAAVRGMRHLAHLASMPETRGQIARLLQEVKVDEAPARDPSCAETKCAP
ncbi:MAG: hypothetical protein Hals2KO_07670 [Halioglobus sp.]